MAWCQRDQIRGWLPLLLLLVLGEVVGLDSGERAKDAPTTTREGAIPLAYTGPNAAPPPARAVAPSEVCKLCGPIGPHCKRVELCDLSGKFSRVPGSLRYHPARLNAEDPYGPILLPDGLQGYAWDRVKAMGRAYLPTLSPVCNRTNHILDILSNFTSFELVRRGPNNYELVWDNNGEFQSYLNIFKRPPSTVCWQGGDSGQNALCDKSVFPDFRQCDPDGASGHSACMMFPGETVRQGHNTQTGAVVTDANEWRLMHTMVELDYVRPEPGMCRKEHVGATRDAVPHQKKYFTAEFTPEYSPYSLETEETIHDLTVPIRLTFDRVQSEQNLAKKGYESGRKHSTKHILDKQIEDFSSYNQEQNRLLTEDKVRGVIETKCPFLLELLSQVFKAGMYKNDYTMYQKDGTPLTLRKLELVGYSQANFEGSGLFARFDQGYQSNLPASPLALTLGKAAVTCEHRTDLHLIQVERFVPFPPPPVPPPRPPSPPHPPPPKQHRKSHGSHRAHAASKSRSKKGRGLLSIDPSSGFIEPYSVLSLNKQLGEHWPVLHVLLMIPWGEDDLDYQMGKAVAHTYPWCSVMEMQFVWDPVCGSPSSVSNAPPPEDRPAPMAAPDRKRQRLHRLVSIMRWLHSVEMSGAYFLGCLGAASGVAALGWLLLRLYQIWERMRLIRLHLEEDLSRTSKRVRGTLAFA